MEIKAKDIKLVDIDLLVENPKNNNTHPEEQIERLAKLISHTGFRNPLVVSNRSGFVLCGHGRIAAAKKAGLKELPVIYQDFKDESEEYQYMTADNAIHNWSTLDLAKINLDIQELGPFDIDLLGIKDFVVEPLEKFEPQADEDEVPEIVHPISRRGDIWILGNHRLMCGDSTMIDDVEKLMNDQKADLTFTSPPYNANAKAGDGDIFTSKKQIKLYGEGYHDNMDSVDYVDFASTVLGNCFQFTDGFVFWNVSYNAKSRNEYIKQIIPYLDSLIEQVCWRKTSSIPFKGSMMRDWEPIYIFSTNGSMLGLDDVTSNYWQISNQNSQQDNHKACFPVALPEKGISIVKAKSGVLLEPFAGSGSTFIACEKTNRKCFGMELDEKYCDLIIKRWEKYTGKKASLEMTGQTYEELKMERQNGQVF